MSRNLYQAIADCRFKQVKLIVDTGLDLATVRNKKGENPLVIALRIEDDGKRERMFRYLTRRGAKCDGKDKSGKTVMAWTCLLNRPVEMEVVMNETVGAVDFSERDNHGYTVLHYAVFSTNPDIVRYLVRFMNRYDLSVDVLDKHKLTPYVHARRLAYNEIADILAQEGNASTLYGDAKGQRSVQEWERIGKIERRRLSMMDTQRKITEFKINGRLPKIHHVTKSCQSLNMMSTWPRQHGHERERIVGFSGVPPAAQSHDHNTMSTKYSTISSFGISEIMNALTDKRTLSYRIPVHITAYSSLSEEQIRQNREREAMLALKNSKNRRGKKFTSTSSVPNLNVNNTAKKLPSLSAMPDDHGISSVNNGSEDTDGKTDNTEMTANMIDKNTLTSLQEIPLTVE